ncbi:hypothetical protein BN132_247 [Cronobacter turicensis 564]|nr:hypothetical protein BN132_247 [Cronobacter turicensis 564]
MRHANFHIRRSRHFAAVFTGQRDDFHAFGARGVNRFDNVAGVAGGRNAEQDIALAPYRFDIAGEDVVVTEIVADAGDMADVGNGDRRIARTVFTVAPGQLFGEVHRIAVRTAVAAREHFAARFKAVRQQHRRTLDSVNIGFIFQKVSQRFGRFVQLVTNQILVHEGYPSALKSNRMQCSG